MCIKIVQGMYDEARTNAKLCVQKWMDFTVKVSIHQGSALSPYWLSLDKLKCTRYSVKYLDVRCLQLM